VEESRTRFDRAFSIRFGSLRDWQLALSLVCLGFFRKGMGTPAPIDAPKKLVVNGLYRFVRNPMYLAVACLISAQSIARSSHAIFYYLLFFLFGVHLFTVLYEEPHLRRNFGAQYEDYSRQVPRWIPRLEPYRPPTT